MQTMKATGGRAASRERRDQLGQGKGAVSSANDRTRNGPRSAGSSGAVVSAPAPVAVPAAQPAPVATAPAAAAPAPATAAPAVRALGGREGSRARRAGLVQGKGGLQQQATAAPAAAVAAPVEAATGTPIINSGHGLAQAIRAARARNGKGETTPTRPSGRVRTPIQYPAKVANAETYAGKTVTGIRVGQGTNVTGSDQGVDVQVTGSQYIGRETGFSPREGGVKVGASRTAGGLTVTGTQVRSKVRITGDESANAGRITGEADQDLADDLLQRREQGAYTSMQFARQNNPHGQSVFGSNLGRSIKSIGSRDRDTQRAIEQTDGGMAISGTAVGRSARVTGDEEGSDRRITGDQYLMPAARQAEGGETAASRGSGVALGANGRIDPVTGEKVVVSESWKRQRITGVDVEHNPNVSGDEYGVCAPITGSPYVGPGQYDTYCEISDAEGAARRVNRALAGSRVTGNTPLNVKHVTGTHRGGERDITGTPYIRDEVESSMKGDRVADINNRFTVRSPQRDAQLRADAGAVNAPSAAGRITGSFAVGDGKITGNQEFHFNPRARVERDESQSRITGEGRSEGPKVTGGAWGAQSNVTGTEGQTASERNPSERAGNPQGFANATVFKSKGKHEPARQIVTGMVGWSAKSAAKVTLSGGAQG